MKRYILPLVGWAALSGCGGGGMTDTAQPAPVAAQPMGINFTTFTMQLVETQPETTDPVPVQAAQFVFPDDANPMAFAALLPGP